MTWKVHIAKRAEKQLAKIPAKSPALILAALNEMQNNPFGGDVKRLKSERSVWRLRVGAYGVFFDVFPERRRVDVLEIIYNLSLGSGRRAPVSASYNSSGPCLP